MFGRVTSIMLASDSALVEVTGKYCNPCEVAAIHTWDTDDEALREKLWSLGGERVGF